jgi:M6 family metalloprotease-like protein
MTLKKLLTFAVLFFCTLSTQAVPAMPGVKKMFRMADGTVKELTICGDEHFSFYKDDNGQAYRLRNGEQLLPMTLQEVSETWTARRKARLGDQAKRTAARAQALRRVGGPNNATSGQHRGLVILVEFKDEKLATPDAQKAFDRFFNEEGYNEGGNSGSVRDYFLKQSYGKLEINFDVVGPYTCNGSLEHYGAAEGENTDVRPTEMVMEAIDAAAKEIDFTPYDWDGDGEVDQIFLICAGYNQADGAESKYIWPHEWTLEAQGISRTYNGKRLNTYGVSTELWGSAGSNPEKTMSGIGTACHEFSHCLGLPDMYDTASNINYGMGYWDVMCSGTRNGGYPRGLTPAGYTAYERWFSGWLDPTELKAMTRISGMKPIATDPECYVLYNDANHDEFYLLENRQHVDFDEALPGHGLLVVHVDYSAPAWNSNSVNTDPNRQRVTIIPADGSYYNESGDPFPGTTNNTSLTNYTEPAATIYRENVDGRLLMSKPIDNIKESEGLISFVACRPELGIPEPDGGKEVEGQAAFTITWPAVSGAVGYELEVTEIGTAAKTPEEALVRSTDFAKFQSKSVGVTDVSGKMAEYGLSGWSGYKVYTSPDRLRIGSSTEVGYLSTPSWDMTSSSELTVVFGGKTIVNKDGTTDKVKGKVVFYTYNRGESNADSEEHSFEMSGETRLVFNFSTRKDRFWIEFRPESRMSLNYFALYDGTWTAEQLFVTDARANAPRRATTVTNYTTDTNSITLKDMNKSSRFIYKVRALGEEDTFSGWSAEREFSFSNTDGIINLMSTPKDDVIYDLQGHRRSSGDLPKGIYIIGGKKVVK